MVFAKLFDPILNPLLSLHPALVVFIVSLIVASITTLITKFFTDQEKMKSLKVDMKRYQKKIKEAKDDTKKAMELQKKMLALNGDYMRQSMRTTLYTFLPLILFFTWLGAHLAFAPLAPNMPFNVTFEVADTFSDNLTVRLPSGLETTLGETGEFVVRPVENIASIALQGVEGKYDLSVWGSTEYEEFFSVQITTDQLYEESEYKFNDNPELKMITVEHEKLLVFEGVPLFGQLPWIKTFGWFGAYFLFSFGLTTALRRLFKVV